MVWTDFDLKILDWIEIEFTLTRCWLGLWANLNLSLSVIYTIHYHTRKVKSGCHWFWIDVTYVAFELNWLQIISVDLKWRTFNWILEAGPIDELYSQESHWNLGVRLGGRHIKNMSYGEQTCFYHLSFAFSENTKRRVQHFYIKTGRKKKNKHHCGTGKNTTQKHRQKFKNNGKNNYPSYLIEGGY